MRQPSVMATISLCNQHGQRLAVSQAQYLPMLYLAATKLMWTKMCPIFALKCPFIWFVYAHTVDSFLTPNSMMLLYNCTNDVTWWWIVCSNSYRYHWFRGGTDFITRNGRQNYSFVLVVDSWIQVLSIHMNVYWVTELRLKDHHDS